jgi:hypothetical protein
MLTASGSSQVEIFGPWLPPAWTVGAPIDRAALLEWERALGHSVFVADRFEQSALDQAWEWWQGWSGAVVTVDGRTASFPATAKGFSDWVNDYVSALGEVGATYPVQIHATVIERVLRELGIYRAGVHYTQLLIDAGIVNPAQVAVVQQEGGTVTAVLAGTALAVGDPVPGFGDPLALSSATVRQPGLFALADPVSVSVDTGPGTFDAAARAVTTAAPTPVTPTRGLIIAALVLAGLYLVTR